MPHDDHKEDTYFSERCVAGCMRLWVAATAKFGAPRVRLALAGVLLLLYFVLAAAFDVGIVDVAAVVFVAAVLAAFLGLLIVAYQLLMSRATVTIGPNNPTEATTTAQIYAPGLPAEATARTPMSSRNWLRSWPWQTVLRGDCIEVRSLRRPPVVISLSRVVRITIDSYPNEGYEALTLTNGAGETIAQVVQNDFAVVFLAALAETTGTEIEYLPLSGGRPSAGGAG